MKFSLFLNFITFDKVSDLKFIPGMISDLWLLVGCLRVWEPCCSLCDTYVLAHYTRLFALLSTHPLFRTYSGNIREFFGGGGEVETHCFKHILEQKCIPVGCVPSAAVAVGWWGYLPGGGVSARHPLHAPPPVNRMTDRHL